jgi:trimeric autotransporter adhesin
MTERKLRRPGKGGWLLLFCAVAWMSGLSLAMASEYHGQVTFGGLPLPGSTVTVTATQGDKTAVAITDSQGFYSFADLADGKWTITIEMTGFAPVKQEVTVAPNAAAGAFEMKLLTLEQMRAAAKPVKEEAAPAASASAATAAEGTNPAAPASQSAPTANPAVAAGTGTAAAGTGAAAANTAAAAKKKGAAAKTEEAGAAAPVAPMPAPEPDATAQQASDGLLINGSVNNAATSQYSMSQAFGNTRSGGRSLYNYGLSLVLNNSALNAKPYSLTGLDTPIPSNNKITAGASFGGPLNIKHLMPRGPYLNLLYSRTQNSTITTQPALVPTQAQRAGNFSGLQIFNPATGTQYTGNVPISAQAQALLNLYPLPSPSLAGDAQYNYQVPLNSDSHQDTVQAMMSKMIGNKNYLYGGFNFTSARSSNTNLFGFEDSTGLLNLSVNATWYHRFTQRVWMTATYSFSRSRTQVTPYFANRENVEGDAGIANGADATPANWGPPGLGFASGIASLSDTTSSYNRPETNSLSYNVEWDHLRHNIKMGGDFRRQESNIRSQANPEGSLSFTGAATQKIVNGVGVAGTGSDFADFLLGVPDTSSIAYGNADKYLRQSVYDLYARDDFRVNSEFSVNWGIRWEYGAPVTELKGRLVNLDIGPGFTAEQAVLASNPVGALTGQSYPTSLVRPDKIGVAPNIGIAWRPISGSSLLIRSGYQISHDTSVYQASAMAMAQQAPLSTSLSVSGSPGCQLSMANPFTVQTCAPTTTTQDTFAVDPNLRVGYVQIWSLSVQRDLPGSLQMVASYLGNKGTRGVQEFLPNTAPPGGTDPYAAYPSGYLYRTSNGNSTREAGSIELRRRLRSGLQAGATYTFSKSLDDVYSLGGQGGVGAGGGVAQNWKDLSGQRGLSTSDQRHVLSANAQYTTGMGLGGKTLMSGWKGLAYKEWTVSTTIRYASGLPETPIVSGETVLGGGANSGSIRANYVGGPVHLNSPGVFLNAAAFAAPAAGQWGTARRDSITGPNQFSLNASMQRTFRLSKRLNLSTQLDATNVLNHVMYSGWYTSVGSPQFGAPSGTNGMRTLQITMRLRY